MEDELSRVGGWWFEKCVDGYEWRLMVIDHGGGRSGRGGDSNGLFRCREAREDGERERESMMMVMMMTSLEGGKCRDEDRRERFRDMECRWIIVVEGFVERRSTRSNSLALSAVVIQR